VAIQLDDLVARLRLDTADLDKAKKSVSGVTGRMSDGFKRAGKAAAVGLGAGVAAGAVALAGMTKNAVADEAAQRKLAISLKNSVGATDGQIASVEKYIAATGKLIGVTDDEMRPAFQQLVQSTGSVAEAQDQMSIALDVSAGTGKSLGTVTSALMKANNGTTASLSKLGLKTKDAAGETLSMKDALASMSETFQGQAVAGANTLDGKMSRLKVVFDETKEAIGARLIPIVTVFANFILNKVVPAVEGFLGGLNDTGSGAGRFVEFFRGQVLPVLQSLWGQVQTQLLPALMSLGAAIAANVIPVFKTLAPIVVSLGQAILSKVIPAIASLITFFVKYQNVLVPVAAGILAIVAAMKVYRTTILVVQAVTKAFAAVQLIMNAALAANPIGLIVLALIGLGAALVIAYKKSETFRDIVQGALAGVQAAFRFMWNEVCQPILKFFVNALADAMDMVGNLFDALGKVPGFGWAKKLGEDMHAAAGRTRELADGIRDIPDKDVHVNIIVNTSAINKAQAQLDRFQAAAASPRMQSDSGKEAAKTASFMLPGIMRGLVDGIARSLGPVESDITSDVGELVKRIEDEYVTRGEDAATRIEGRFAKVRERLTKALTKAEKTKGKKDDKEVQAKLDALDAREETATAKAIGRYNRKARAAKKAAAVITAALIDNARQQDENNAKLDVAREKLEGLQTQASDFAASVAKAFTDFGTVVGLGLREIGEDTTVTTEGIIEDLTARVTKAAQFAATIQKLTGMGLNQGTIQELINAGVEGGLATAEAIAAGGVGAVDTINGLQGQLVTLGTELGANLSTTFYGQGITAAQSIVDGLIIDGITLATKASELRTQLATVLGAETKAAGKEAGEGAGREVGDGLVNGLKDSNDRLSHAGRRVAKLLVREFKDELGIRSPSKVFRRMGRKDIGGALALGLEDSTAGIAESAARMTAAAVAGAGIGTVGLGGVNLAASRARTAAGDAATPMSVQVFIGETELTDMVRVEIGSTLSPLTRMTRQGAL
jgi:hypothetical protein